MTPWVGLDKYIAVLDKSNLLQKNTGCRSIWKFNYVMKTLKSLKEDVKSNKYFWGAWFSPMTDSRTYQKVTQSFFLRPTAGNRRIIINKVNWEIKSENTNSNTPKSTEILQKMTLKSTSSRKQLMKKKSTWPISPQWWFLLSGGVVGYAMFSLFVYGVQVITVGYGKNQ